MTAAPIPLPLARHEHTALAFALAGLARLAQSCGLFESATSSPLLQQDARLTLENALQAIPPHPDLATQFQDYLQHPDDSDLPLLAVASHFELTAIETITLRLTVAAEEDLLIGHILTQLQQPLAHGRPTVGLLARAFTGDYCDTVQLLAQGSATTCGLLELLDPSAPLPERQLRVPLPICMALSGLYASWPGASILHRRSPIPLAHSAERQAAAFAQRLLAATPSALIIRCGDSREARSAAERVSLACELRAVLISSAETTGLAPWLFLNQLMPVFQHTLAPGERRPLPAIVGHAGPLIVLSGSDGEFVSDTGDDRALLDWRLTIPCLEERRQLWAEAGAEASLAHRLASGHRHTAGRIAALAAFARKPADRSTGPAAITAAAIRRVSRSGQGISLAALAELVPDEVPDEILIVSPALRQELEFLAARCFLRDAVHAGLGPSMQASYRSAVRALLVGASGTGKTLAASWLATRLGLPLYRVDLSAVTSKYIGETEKNLSQLLTRAEQSEVVLLFDEADSLFAKRTDITDANDRFANSQTSYLLQRMESYDGITLLTSNSRARFDAAFARRLDVILDFPLPGPEERRVLWLAHLGPTHTLTGAQLNLIAAAAELSGGQIRNVVLYAAIAARNVEPVTANHLFAGLTAEYRKQGRQLPDSLRTLNPNR